MTVGERRTRSACWSVVSGALSVLAAVTPARAQETGVPSADEPPPRATDAGTAGDAPATPDPPNPPPPGPESEPQSPPPASAPAEPSSTPSAPAQPSPPSTPAATTAGGEPTARPQPVQQSPASSAPQPAPRPVRQPTAPPPPPADAETPPSADEEEDDGRDVDVLWLEPFGGYSYVNLVQFSQSNFFPSAERTEGNGFTVGLGAGFRLKIITIGGRVSFAKYPDFDLGTVGLDIGIRIPIGAFEPYVRGGLGYAWIGATDYEEPRLSETDVFGLAGEIGAGLDIYFNSVVSIGAGLDAAFLNLTRQDVREDGARLTEINLEEDGDAVGLQLRAHAHLGLHF